MYGDKRTYVWAKAERTCVLLAIGVLSLSSKYRDKRTYVWAKAKRAFVFLAIGKQEREQFRMHRYISSKSGDKKNNKKKKDL